MNSSLYQTLADRGFIHSVSNAPGLRAALDQPSVFYVGFDPTAPSLHTGHLIPLALAAHLAQAGHHPVLLAGGGTGLIGDPTDRSETRALLSAERVAANTQAVRRQVDRLFQNEQADVAIVDNAEWLTQLRYLDFLRDIGRYFSVNEILATETYRARLDSGQGLNFVEINYRLLQAYDFLHLFREHGCILQIGGSDQWANILAGVDLIRRIEGKEAFGLVTPLLTTSTGQKMGKTAAGALWLDPELTSPYDFFQYWINIEDASVERTLALLTPLPLHEVRALASLPGAQIRSAKERLAYEITARVHGADAANAARDGARALFGRDGGSTAAAPQTRVTPDQLAAGLRIVDLLLTSGLAGSRSAARRLIAQGGAYANDCRVDSPDMIFHADAFRDGELLLRSGKKRYHRILLGRE
ncbi:MAG: tyrosine--tRNA ligase [Chloroflexi bacterium]|nr:tyrosine--tRNA ligase [Chloroflexota bacterium]